MRFIPCQCAPLSNAVPPLRELLAAKGCHHVCHLLQPGDVGSALHCSHSFKRDCTFPSSHLLQSIAHMDCLSKARGMPRPVATYVANVHEFALRGHDFQISTLFSRAVGGLTAQIHCNRARSSRQLGNSSLATQTYFPEQALRGSPRVGGSESELERSEGWPRGGSTGSELEGSSEGWQRFHARMLIECVYRQSILPEVVGLDLLRGSGCQTHRAA